VPDLTHDAAEEGFHEIQLSGKQIVFLVMVVTVVSAVIFLCGVLVGRGVRSERADVVDDTVAAAATAPPPATDSAPAAATEPPAPPSEAGDALSYHKRLQGETKPAEELKPPAATPAPPSPDTAKPQPPPAPAATPPTTAPPPAASDVPTSGRPGAWIVQVIALRDPAAARNVVKDLASKGFPAFLVNPAHDMPVIYRVQVGGFANRADAEQVSRRIEKEEQFKPQVRQVR
jgi:cell division septation protein DedD